MKIYIQDHSWMGMIVVIASSEIEARELMKQYHNYDMIVEIKSYEIKNGFSFANYGDM